MAISSIIRLSTPVAALLLACSLIVYICIGCFVNYRKLSHFKGPPLAAVTRGWLMMQSLSGRVHIAEAEALKKYGTKRHPASVISARLTPGFLQALLHALDLICL